MTSTPTTSTLFSRTRTARRIAAACGAGVLLLGAGACGSSDPVNVGQSTSGTGTGNSGPSTTQQGNRRPGTDGKIAAVADSTAQVQSAASGQVAVSWTASTTFTKQVSAKLADVQVGDCVMVTSESTGTSGGTTPPAQATEVTATSVRISDPVDGSCTPTGFGGPGGPQAGTGDGPQFQGGAPDGGTAGGPPAGGTPPGGGQFRGTGGAFGRVASVSAKGFVVESTRPAQGDTAAETTTVTVTVAGTTTYTTTAKGSAADVKVGQCLRADGEADDTGAVTATKIAITPPTDGECGGILRRTNGSGPGVDSAQAS